MRICIPGEAHPHSQRGTSPFPVSHIAIPGEDVYSIVIHPHWECTSSSGMGVCLTGNGDVPHREWGCASLGMYILTGNGDVPHREHTSSLGMYILTGNAHSLYRVLPNNAKFKVQMKCFFIAEFERAAKIRKNAIYRFLISLLVPEL